MSRAMSAIRCFALLSGLVLSSASQCLPDAVPENQRLNISLEGVSMPVGITAGNWPSAGLAAKMLHIMVQEVLGYHAHEHLNDGGSTAIVQELAGCADIVERPELCPWPPRDHIGLEIWPNRWFAEANKQLLVTLDDRAPRNLGELGYLGVDGLFILGKARQRCLEANGLHLSYYGNYNSSWFDPAACAATLSDVDLGRLKDCEHFWLEYPSSGKHYLDATGDVDGVQDGRKLQSIS